MKEHPLVLSATQVRAVIEGRKTQHRILIKPQPRMGMLADGTAVPGCPQEYGLLHHSRGDELTQWDCIHGKAGDRLWVREACLVCIPPTGSGRGKVVLYKADDWGRQSDELGVRQWRCIQYTAGFMPRVNARILLEITGVRIESLQSITEQAATAEGCYHSDGVPDRWGMPTELVVYARDEFRDGWDRKHGGTASAWTANPWVWVLEFMRVQP